MGTPAAAASISKSLARFLHRTRTLYPSPAGSVANRLFPSLYFSSSASSVPSPPSASSAQAQEKTRSIWSKMFLFLPGAIAFGLGTWQIFRREDKIKMLDYRQSRLGMEPINFNSAYSSEKKKELLEFRRMMCKGIFDDKRSIFVGPRSRSISGVTENGYYLITPLMPIPADSESVQVPVLVNRGWVPRSWRDQFLKNQHNCKESLHTESTPSQESTKSSWWKFWSKKANNVKDIFTAFTPNEVTGVVRGSEKPSIFVPANDPGSSQWFYVDVPAIARSCGLPENTIYIEDINDNVSPTNPYPAPKEASTLIRSSVMPQDHVNYILTWYSLSAAVMFMAFKRLKPRKSKR